MLSPAEAPAGDFDGGIIIDKAFERFQVTQLVFPFDDKQASRSIRNNQ